MLLAAIPYAVLQVDRAVRALLRGFGGVPLVVVLLLSVAAVPLALEGARQQPLNETVDGLRDGFSGLAGWVRMSGRIVTLTPPEAVEAGEQVQSLLIEPSGDAILMVSNRRLEDQASVTGHVSNSANAGRTARAIAGPRFPDEDLDVIDDFVLTVDNPIVPDLARNWTVVWLPLLLAGLLVVGRAIGYPVVRLREEGRPRSPARPMREGETLPVRLVSRSDETQPGLRAPAATLRRLERREAADPYFSLEVEGRRGALQFRRHRWARAAGGTLWTLRESTPVVELRDWGVEVLLTVASAADRDRLLASFAQDEESPGEAGGASRADA